MKGNELISFQIISSVGTARSLYVEAIQEAKKGNIDGAKQLIEDGVKIFVEGHRAHASLIQKEAEGEQTEFSLLLMHAEDQLMTTETLKIIAEEFIDIYQDKFNR